MPSSLINKHARRWIKWLRSGRYPQTKYHLHDDWGFCCQGVACDLFHKELGLEKDVSHLNEDYTPNEVFVYYDRSSTTWPAILRNHLGISLEGSTSLQEMNDREDSFEKIADALEQNPEHFFEQ